MARTLMDLVRTYLAPLSALPELSRGLGRIAEAMERDLAVRSVPTLPTAADIAASSSARVYAADPVPEWETAINEHKQLLRDLNGETAGTPEDGNV